MILLGFFLVLHVFIFSVSSAASQNGGGVRLCGYPGRPVNGSSLSTGSFYQQGEKVRYQCNDGFVISGDQERECQSNGSWSGSIPTCDFNLAQGKTALQSETLWNYKPELALDGNLDTCSFTPRVATRWWQASLGRRYNVVRVSVAISIGSEQKFTIYIIELMDDNKALYKPCATFSGVFETLSTDFICNDGLGHPGHFVYIRDDRKRDQYLGLCEVQVFAHRERIPCGDPERPPNSKVTVSEDREQAEYECDAGYRATGDITRQCLPDGAWSGFSPYCIAVECESPPSILHGTHDATPNEDKVYVYGATATYKCNEGYVAWGNTTLTCQKDAKWTRPAPQCREIRCSEPPSFPHTLFELRNGNTFWKSTVTYSCEHGYVFHNDTKETSTVCESTGSWKPIHIECVMDQTMSKMRNAPSEVTAADDDDNGVPIVVSALLIGLVVGILLISMIMVYLKKRRSRNEKSLKPVVQRKISALEHKPIPPGMSPSLKPMHHDPPIPPMRSKHVYASADPLPPKPILSSTESFNNKGKKAEEAQGISNPIMDDDPDYARIPQDEEEPPYEKIKNNDPNYEKIRDANDTGSTYEETNVSESGYEKIGNENEHGYEKIKNRADSGYETIRKVSENDPGYETIEGGQNVSEEPDYEVIHPRKESVGQSSLVGYEVIKPKRRHSSKKVTQVPDILKEITTPPPTPGEATKDPPEFPKDAKSLTWQSRDVPPEILALYAKVDKTKKTKYRNDLTHSTESLHTTEEPEGLTKSHTCPVRLCKEGTGIGRRDSLHNLHFPPGKVADKTSGDGTPYLLSSSSSLDSEEVSSDGRHSSCSSTPRTLSSNDSGAFMSSSPVTPPMSPLRPLPPIPSDNEVASL